MTFGRAMTSDEMAASALRKQQELESEVKRLRNALEKARDITYTPFHGPRQALVEIQKHIDQILGKPNINPGPRNKP
jgi:hypothetical protein